MAEEVEFGQVNNKPIKKKKRGVILYPPKNNAPITIRFVGKQHKVYQRWDQATRKSTFHNSRIDGSVQKFISFVIDRADGEVKAAVCPSTVFERLGEYSPDHDFKISRQGFGMGSTYHVESFGPTIVSDELELRIDITSQVYDLADIFIKNIKWELLDVEYEPISNRFDILDL